MNQKRKVYREGQRFGKLTLLEYVKTKKYLCRCDCGKEKIFHTCNLLHGTAKSCGCIDSIHRGNYDEDAKKKLLDSIKIADSGCWEWQRSRHKQGYGHFPYKRKVMLAHRVSWILYHGILDPNILVLHKCDNPSCVNPDHLFLGTDRDNVLDSISKNRFYRGMKKKPYSIKQSQIDEIRQLSSKGWSQKKIGQHLGISREYVGAIVRGTSRPASNQITKN